MKFERPSKNPGYGPVIGQYKRRLFSSVCRYLIICKSSLRFRLLLAECRRIIGLMPAVSCRNPKSKATLTMTLTLNHTNLAYRSAVNVTKFCEIAQQRSSCKPTRSMIVHNRARQSRHTVDCRDYNAAILRFRWPNQYTLR